LTGLIAAIMMNISHHDRHDPGTASNSNPLEETSVSPHPHASSSSHIRLFLGGDVMTGRAIDQILPHPGNPRIHEKYVTMATDYITMAEGINGPIPTGADFGYIWGEGLAVLKQHKPDLRIVNLETAITTNSNYWKGKGVNYRMNPKNTPVLKAAEIDFCALANNHAMDYGLEGLKETIRSLNSAKIKYAGAGENSTQAAEPAVLDVTGKGRVIIFSLGSTSSGIPDIWGADSDRPGINLLNDFSQRFVAAVKSRVRRLKKENDIAVLSIHWGANWGYDVLNDQRALARAMIDEGGVDLIHGHSSHHPLGLEVYKDKLIIYGAGDLINDYEGIRGHSKYRPDLGLMYFPQIDPSDGTLQELTMVPVRKMNFQIIRASTDEAQWLESTLRRECRKLGTGITAGRPGAWSLLWGKSLIQTNETKEEAESDSTGQP
jgi:poly-gamma-glutamate synthesis protein (capsule biosynthesis protein)